MLPKINRLNLKKTKESFKGKRVFSKDLTLIFSKADCLKTAVVVSKKVAPRAVDRNRIKRQITDVLKDKKIGAQLVFIANTNIANFKKSEIEATVSNLLKRIND